MAFNPYELTTIDANGPSAGNAGAATKMHRLVTNDADTVVEADGYLDTAAEKFTPGVGDVIQAVLDADGTPEGKMYVVTRTDGDIALTIFS